MRKVIDLIGQKFGKLTVISQQGRRKTQQIVWDCICDCGNSTRVSTTNLKNGHTRSCGCYQKERASQSNLKNIIGKRFGRLIVNYQAGRTKHGQVIWHCTCDCGNEKDITSSCLLKGETRSCGCYKKEIISQIKSINLTGKKFGRLLVIKKSEKYHILPSGRKLVLWCCLCDCGNYCNILANSLKRGNTCSCGCLQKEKAIEIGNKNLKSLIGKKFGNLLVIEKANFKNQPSGQRKTAWLCKCDCGNLTVVSTCNLKNNHVKSCGCLSEPFLASQLKKYFVENYNAETEYNILKNPNTNHYLPYDIYIPRGESLNINGIYIEINGKQHYSLSGWHGLQSEKNNTSPEKEFYYQKEKDNLKKKFARKNGAYVEVDLRKIGTTEEAIRYIEKKI